MRRYINPKTKEIVRAESPEDLTLDYKEIPELPYKKIDNTGNWESAYWQETVITNSPRLNSPRLYDLPINESQEISKNYLLMKDWEKYTKMWDIQNIRPIEDLGTAPGILKLSYYYLRETITYENIVELGNILREII